MNRERAKLVIKLLLGIAAISVCCLLIIFVMRACSADDAAPDSSDAPVTSTGDEDDSASGSGSGTDISDDALSGYVDYEDNSDYESLGNYMNDRVLTYDYGSGTISLGVELGVQDYIYLNPVCSEAAAEDGKQIGFFITASSPGLEISYPEGAAAADESNAQEANLVMLGQTYDTAVPAGYKSAEDYGVRWERDKMEINEDNGGTTLYIRAVNLSSGELIAMCKATIVYDASTDTHHLDTLTSSDVVDTGEMTQEEKSALVQDAVSFMQGTGNFTPPNEADWTNAAGTAKVEHVPEPYFTQFSDTKGQQARAFDFPYNRCEIWAVNLQFPTGFITVYFAPYLQTLGMESMTAPGETDIDLRPIGYACLNPFTEDTILW